MIVKLKNAQNIQGGHMRELRVNTEHVVCWYEMDDGVLVLVLVGQQLILFSPEAAIMTRLSLEGAMME